MPQISIIIPAYNVENYIARCLDSIFNQTITEFEIVIVNDCSSDNTLSVVRNYANNDARILVLDHENNKGPMRARENGIRASSGRYVTFCDGDDTLPRNALEILLGAIDTNNADIVSGDIMYYPLSAAPRCLMGGHKLKYGNTPQDVFKSMMLNEYGHNLCGKLFKRSLFDNEHDCFDDCPNGEDGYLFYQILSYSSKVCHVREPVYNYYQNVNSTTQTGLTEKGIRSLLLHQKLRVQLMSKYPDISKLFEKSVINALVYRYQYGEQYHFNLPELYKEYGLDKIFSTIYVLNNYGIQDAMVFFFKKHWYYKVNSVIKYVRSI